MAARNPFASSIPDAFDPYALISSSRPARLSTGYYFVRNLLLVGAIVGGVVALYRNDLFRELARRVGQEERYLSVERQLIGTPGWGTPRSMEPVLAQTAGSPSPEVAAPLAAPLAETRPAETAAPVPAAPAAEPPPAAAPAAAPAPVAVAPAPEPVAAAPVAVAQQPVAATPAPKPVDPLAPVSLDSLPLLTKGGAAQPVAFNQPPAAAAAPAPAPVARSFAPAPAPAARPAPVDRSKAKAIRVSLDETPAPGTGRSIPPPTRAAAPPPEPAPAPAPVVPKPEKSHAKEVHKNDNPLMAAVRGAVRARPPKESVPAAP